MKLKLFLISILAAVIAFCSADFTAFASASGLTGVYVTKRTQSEIREYIAAHPFSVSGGTTYSTEPDLITPYDNAGAVSSSSLTNALNALNCVRYIAGLDEVSLSSDYSQQAQMSAYISRLNQTISHYPQKPSGVSDSIYNTGSAACAKANLASGYNNIADSIFGYIEDSDVYNIEKLGHRRWCLNPRMGKTGFGEVDKYQSMWAFDTSNSSAKQAGVVWPAQNMPVEYFGSDYAWSYSLGQVISDTSNVSVTLTRTFDKKTWNFSKSSADGYFNVNNEYYGEAGCVIFRPNNVSYKSGDSFTVSISGTGLPVNYTVDFFSVGTASAPNTVAGGKPSAVTGLKATATANSVKLTWNKNAMADSYQVDMYKNGKWVRLGKTVNNNYTAEGLEADKTYEFKVFAFNREEYSPSAKVTAATKSAVKVAAVTGLKAAVGSDSADLSWNKNTIADKYQVDVYKDGKWVRLGRTTDNKFTAEGLSPRTGYEFKVFAFSGEVYSPSASLSITTLGGAANTGTPKPDPVTNLTAEASGNNGIRLSWSKSTGADKYQIDMYKDGEWKYVAQTKTSVYTVRGLETGTGYKFRVFAFKGSSFSSSVKASAVTNGTSSSAIDTEVPAAVTNLTSASGSNSIRLTWTKSKKANKYQIDIYKNGKWQYVAQTSGNSFTVRNLSPGTTYQFKVFALGDNGASPSAGITARTS